MEIREMEPVENGNTNKIYERLCSVMSEIEAVSKNKTNQQQNYKYRSIDDVYNMIQPIFGKNKVFIIPKVCEIKEEERQSKSGGILTYTTLTMEYTFYTDDGSFITTTAVGKSMDSGDKSLDKAKSSAMKYLLLQMFVIPTEEDKDNEKDDPQPVGKDKPKENKHPQTQPEQAKPTETKTEQPEQPEEGSGKYHTADEFINRIMELENSTALAKWMTKHNPEINKLENIDDRTRIRQAHKDRAITLSKAENMTN